jgi:hypothetical protein
MSPHRNPIFRLTAPVVVLLSISLPYYFFWEMSDSVRFALKTAIFETLGMYFFFLIGLYILRD